MNGYEFSDIIMQEISDFPATEMQEITEMCFTSRDTP
jgi:hypothetical protein